MKTPKNIVGQKFGRLTAIRLTHINRDGKACWDCKCECGKECNVSGKNLRNGNTKSCGCYAKEKTIQASTTHGGCVGGKTKEYFIWRGIKDRCLNPRQKKYSDYGGRGITVCDRWKNSFALFLKDMGTKPFPKAEVERIDNNKGYSPDNCKWGTRKEQTNNTRANRILSFNGESMTVSQWADKLGKRKGMLYQRLHRGWSVKKTLTHGL